MHDKPAEAVIFLENAIGDDPAYVKTWLYLGVVYEQLNRFDEAIAAYRRVLPAAGSLSANVANNLGNVYFKRGDIQMAEQFYSQAIGFDSVYSRAYLGRANTLIKAGNLRNAMSDYEQYLTLEPRTPQRSGIEQVIGLLREEFAAEERRKLLAEEEERRVAEELRIAEEIRQAEEIRVAEERRVAEEIRQAEELRIAEERRVAEELRAAEERRLAEERQRLLDAVSASLQAAADYSQSISSGAESVEGYHGEFELE